MKLTVSVIKADIGSVGGHITPSARLLDTEYGAIQRLAGLADEVKERAVTVGINAEEDCRAGSFFQMDHSVILSSARQSGLKYHLWAL
jgi:fructose 1,6-bisphosphatase